MDSQRLGTKPVKQPPKLNSLLLSGVGFRDALTWFSSYVANHCSRLDMFLSTSFYTQERC